jgi:two-component system, NtrC family, response regulator HydG
MTFDSRAEEVTALLQQRFDPSPLPEPFRLSVIDGDDAGKTFEIDGSQPSRLLVGSSPACTIHLTDKTVSRRHVALDVVGRRVRIADLGSTNGTRVSGVAVTEGFLEGGEVVTVGATSFRLDPVDDVRRVQISNQASFGQMVGASTEMRRLYPLCQRLAQSMMPVIVEGETGTGKELLAESLHQESARAEGPFVVLDCSAVPANLLEVELFGHVASPYAGGAPRRGVFEQANGGTLLLDEIGDLDLALQPKLLRAIERQEIRPVGSGQALQVDVRVIASTRRDLDREVQAGRFRDDLLHRLAVARIELPPLRQRRGDVPILVRHFCKELQGDESNISKELRRSWDDYHWPGNVRELRNTLARHLALGELAHITQHSGAAAAQAEFDLTTDRGDIFEQALGLPLGDARQRVVEEFERRYVERMLESHGGNVTRAAESAGVARRYFQILKARVAKKKADGQSTP